MFSRPFPQSIMLALFVLSCVSFVIYCINTGGYLSINRTERRAVVCVKWKYYDHKSSWSKDLWS